MLLGAIQIMIVVMILHKQNQHVSSKQSIKNEHRQGGRNGCSVTESTAVLFCAMQNSSQHDKVSNLFIKD